MKIIELAKELKIIDFIVLALDERGYSDSEIATICDITPATLHNTKNKLKPVLEALKMVTSPPTEYGNPDINKIIKAFSEAFGNTKTTKYDRFASKRLKDKYGTEDIIRVINALSASQNDKYAPTVRSVAQFEEKLPQIASYFKKKEPNQIIEL